jgi:large subunit ribosomal protein L13
MAIQEKKKEEEILIDGTRAVLGRIASIAAKKALQNRNAKVLVFNCNEMIIIGKPESTIAHYKEKRDLGGSALKGPFFPRSPEMIVRRTIRGMIPYKNVRGREAFKRIKCYNGITNEYLGKEKISFKSDAIKFITLLRLSELL